MGLIVGWLGYYFDKDKKKGVDIYLFVGVIIGYTSAFVVHFLIWPVPEGEINYLALIVAAAFTYFKLSVIDYFFHL